MNKEVLTTNTDLCVGCNKCIAACRVKANLAFQHNGENKVKVDQQRCIHCGECIDVCDHNVRYFADDTDRFFSDLKQGLSISIIAAPATKFNFPNYKRLFGYLKSLGVKIVYDVSFGADITTWAYLKAIKEQNLESIIAQSCPVIVNYIQKYRPEIIKNLAPIHSPMMCTAIYLKKYKGVKDRIAFLSPCIGKIDEINEENTGGLVKYNVTFSKIERYIEHNNINLSNYKEEDYDAVGNGLGLTFSRPGGLSENVEFYTDGAWVRQLEGAQHVYDYLDEYAIRVRECKQLPLIVDILSCRHGCNLGTGTSKSISIDDIDSKMNQFKNEKIINSRKDKLNKETDALWSAFDKEFQLSDFMRRYENKSLKICNAEDQDLEQVFMQLHKTTEASRKINCYSCGYGSCTEFAKAVAQGANHLANCIDYNRKELVSNKEHLSQTNKEVVQLHYLATHDFLTNIPNRYYLENYLKQLIITAETADKKSESALIFIDIDNFKVVNDSFGHAIGDKILIMAVDRLQRNLSQEAILARLGGDEFAVVLKDTSLEKAKDVANKLLQALRKEEFKMDSHQSGIHVTASLGITMIDATVNPQDIFSYADIALYSAKEDGKNRIITVRTGEDKARLSESNRIIEKINYALKENRFILYYQPVFKMDNTIIHYEALLRMVDQDGKLIFPNEFMPIAERFGLISQIDRWVVNAAIKFLDKHPGISVFVNISGSSLGDEELLNYIEARIHKSNIQPSRIGFEITETAVIRDLNQVEHWIRRIKLIGCKFALDDFGVGFSSFTYLQRIPVDYLKIDGSFIRNLDVDPTQRALVQAMNDVAHAVGKETIAEYVENEKIWSILRRLKIDCGQGYFLGKPAPLDEKQTIIYSLG